MSSRWQEELRLPQLRLSTICAVDTGSPGRMSPLDFVALSDLLQISRKSAGAGWDSVKVEVRASCC